MKINLVLFYRLALIFFSISMVGVLAKLFIGNENFYRSFVGPLNLIIFAPTFFLSFLATVCGLILILKKEKPKVQHILLFSIIFIVFGMLIFKGFFD